MFVSLLYVILAILGLSFLIFIHELGHYWMARRVGMRVEVFSIGFGRPIFSWMHNGARWQIGWLLFGGYVKIAGQELEKGTDPYQVSDGFFGKSPWDRIKVAFMGPFVNILFALIAFGGLWLLHGREKNFSEFTHKIGWIDPKSDLYKAGIRPGDEILEYNGSPYVSDKDNIYAPLNAGEEIEIKGLKVDYESGNKQPFVQKVKVYPHPFAGDKGFKTAGILSMANYVIYNRIGNQENPLPQGSPLEESGIQYGDRVLWADGELVYSLQQLNQLLNDNHVLLTIKRDGTTFLRRIPRVHVEELWLDPEFREELTDWQFEAQLNNIKFQKLFAIPYNLNNEGVVENQVRFIDKEKEKEEFPEHPFSDNYLSLQQGDKIIAIDGYPIAYSYELLARLQKHEINVIVERNPADIIKVSSTKADAAFDKDIDYQDLEKITSTLGTEHSIKTSGDLALLKPITLKSRTEFTLPPEKQAWAAAEQLEQKKEIEAIEDPEKRAHELRQMELRDKQLLLGLPQPQDRRVTYNPEPLELFKNVFQEIWYTLTALLTGTMSLKGLSGPVGIVQVVHDNSLVSLKEALFWLGAISLNLGILNLLPIPVLDGGTILLSLCEWVTGRKINPKTLEKIGIPFAILLILLFIFLTYQDLSRIFTRFWHW